MNKSELAFKATKKEIPDKSWEEIKEEVRKFNEEQKLKAKE